MFYYSLTSLMVFSEVVKCRSFSKAAGLLFMTQPGVSRHITQLEAQMGATLLRRGRGRFEVTRDGREVYRYAERIEKTARELEERLRAARGGVMPLLRLGTTDNYAKKIMPYILAGFQRSNPDVRLKINTSSSDEMEKTLLTGQNDLIIVVNQHPSNKIQSFPFVREELVLITSKNHPLAMKDIVSLSDISAYPFAIREDGSATRAMILAAFSKMNISPSVFIEVNSTEFIKEWVAQGKAVSILIRRAIEGEEDEKTLAVLPLAEPLHLEVSVLFLKSSRHNASVQRFIAYLQETSMCQGQGAAISATKISEQPGS